jgi:hypothetical protein
MSKEAVNGKQSRTWVHQLAQASNWRRRAGGVPSADSVANASPQRASMTITSLFGTWTAQTVERRCGLRPKWTDAGQNRTPGAKEGFLGGGGGGEVFCV